jgi:ubiquinone/menaquinone biosynthesis C-methylase UbiE
MISFIYKILVFFEKIFLLSRLYLSSLTKRFINNLDHTDLVISSTDYDMVDAPSEKYYAEQYWRVLQKYLPNNIKYINVCDLGCSQGRITAKFAIEFPNSNIFACDISQNAIMQAIRRAKILGINNRVNYQVSTINDFLINCEDNSVDIMIMTEVTFFYPNWVNDFALMIKKLRINGIIIMSFRSQYYDALSMVRARLFKNIDILLSNRVGNIYNSGIKYSWHQSEEVRQIFKSHTSLQMLEICGIGSCSGISGDPHDVICKPHLLDESERESLMKLEMELGKYLPDAGRYMLVVAKKVSDNFD